MAFRFHISQYLTRRAADWKAQGLHRDARPIGPRSTRARNSGATTSAPRSRTGRRSPIRAIRSAARQGVNERIMLRELLRRVDMMVILENKLDALVRLHTPWPPGLIGARRTSTTSPATCAPESLSGPNAGLTEVLIPAGYVTTVYDPVFKLTPDGKRYVSQAVRQADDDPGARPAVLAGVPRRARQGGRAAEDRLGLRGGVAAPRPAAEFRAVVDFRALTSLPHGASLAKRCVSSPSGRRPSRRIASRALSDGVEAVRRINPDTAGRPCGTSSPRRG